MPERALVVDATNLLLGGFEAGSDPEGALGVAISALRRALGFRDPALAVAVIDSSPALHEHPESMRRQHALLDRVCAAHGFATVTADEPIQLVASYVRAALDGGFDAMTVSTDKRLAQLVSDDVWWNDPYKRVRYTPELVRKRFEVEPAQVAGWLALVGDRDSLPGVKGLGKKGATTLVQEHGSVEAALADPDAVQGRNGKVLRAELESAHRELERATLRTDVALPRPLDELGWSSPDVEALNGLYAELGLHRLLQADGPDVQTELCDTAEKVAAWLGELEPRPTAVLAVTEDPSPARGALVGLVLSQGTGPAYVPVALAPSLRSWLEDEAAPKVGHACKSVVVALARLGITLRGVVSDTESASHLTDPTGFAPHDLDDLSRRVLQRPLEPDDAVRGIGQRRKRWGALKPEKVAAHIGPWASACHALHERLTPGVDGEQLAEYLALSDTLARMELAGIACDAEDLAASATDFARIEGQVEAQIHAIAGREFNIGSTKQLGDVLFGELGLTVIKRTKTGWSTASSALERIEDEHPIVPLVMRWRRVRWLRTTWADALVSDIEADGRVRATFHHARSFSGRIICSSPDLGRVPGRTEEMTRIRHAFHAPPGSVLLSVDYDQLGLYVLAHLSGDRELVGALSAGADLHRITAAAVLQIPQDAVTTEQRQTGKVVNFATFAGQGASALALQLGVSAADAKDIIARFYEHYSGVAEFQEGELRSAMERGYIETLAGRRQYVGGFDSQDTALRAYADRVGRRATHEGSVADVTRRALLASDVALREAGLRGFPVLQLLDEVLFEVPEDELEQTIAVTAEAMRRVYELRVPLRVTGKVGARWGAMEEIAV